MITKIEVYELMKEKNLEVPNSFENFMSLLERAVINWGEGQKLGGSENDSDYFCIGSQRIEKLNMYLNFLQIGEKNHTEIMGSVIGNSWEDFKRIYRYKENFGGPKSDKFYERLFFGGKL